MIDTKKLEELKIEYISKFDERFEEIDPYNYDNIIWEEIKNKAITSKEEISNIEYDDEDKFKAEYNKILNDFLDFVKKEKSLKSDLLTSRENFMKNVREITTKVTSVVTYVWKKVKFLFATPACCFASFVFTMFITLLLATLFNAMFPRAYSEEYEGIVDAVIASGLFIVIRCALYKDVYDNQVDTNIKFYLIKHLIACALWSLPIIALKYKQEIININDFNYFEWALYLPYLTISGFLRNFYYPIYLTYAIVNIIPFIYILIYVRSMEKFYDKREEEKKFYDLSDEIKDDSYEYRFVDKEEYGLDNLKNDKKQE